MLMYKIIVYVYGPVLKNNVMDEDLFLI